MSLQSTSTHDLTRPHSPAQKWSFRVPSPPRIIVPPPSLSANGLPDLHVVGDHAYTFSSSGFANVEFLRTVTYGNFMKSNAMLDWKYEQRRMAQQVLPFLYLGPSSAARDKEFLVKEGISLVLAVRNTLSAQARLLGSKAAQELGIDVQAIDVAGNQELIAAFPRGIEIINTHLSRIYQEQLKQTTQGTVNGDRHTQARSGKVLVFCESGNERSASLVVAYIMAMYSKDLIMAIQIVQAQRFAVAFDDSLRNLLSTYETILQAKRDVIQADRIQGTTDGIAANRSHHPALLPSNAAKRSLQDAYDDDEMEMDHGAEEMDFGRFEKREGIAPFQDRPVT
ncbi:MAG: hypothetical protein Q9217_002764 [Psora testacea]